MLKPATQLRKTGADVLRRATVRRIIATVAAFAHSGITAARQPVVVGGEASRPS